MRKTRGRMVALLRDVHEDKAESRPQFFSSSALEVNIQCLSMLDV